MSRWWGIRHARYGWHGWRMAQGYRLWAAYGYGGPAASDLAMLGRIWRGEAE